MDGHLRAHRYDVNCSGTIDSDDELNQLCFNLSFKLQLNLSPDDLDSLMRSKQGLPLRHAQSSHPELTTPLAGLGPHNGMRLDEFRTWFEGELARHHITLR